MKTDQLLITFILFGLLCVIPAKSGVLDLISGLSDPITTSVNDLLGSTNNVLIPKNPGCINNTNCTNNLIEGLNDASEFIKVEKNIGHPISIGPLQNCKINPGETFKITLVDKTLCSKFNYSNNPDERRDNLTIQVDDIEFTGTIDLMNLNNWLNLKAPILGNPFSSENCPSLPSAPSLPNIDIDCLDQLNIFGFFDDDSIASGNFKTKLSKLRIHILVTARSNRNWTVNSIVSDVKNLEISNVQCNGDDTFEPICNCLITKKFLTDLIFALININLKCQIEGFLNDPNYDSMRCMIFTPPSG